MVNSFVTLNKKEKAFTGIASEFTPDFIVISPPVPLSMGSMVFALYEVVHGVKSLKGLTRMTIW